MMEQVTINPRDIILHHKHFHPLAFGSKKGCSGSVAVMYHCRGLSTREISLMIMVHSIPLKVLFFCVVQILIRFYFISVNGIIMRE